MNRTRVLIADPNRELVQAYDAALSRRGFDVATANDALECVSQLRKFRPQLLVLEPELPWGWGEGVLAMMDEDVDVPRVPVMLVSTRNRPDLPGSVANTVIAQRLLKPLPPQQLTDHVLDILGNPIF